MKKNIFLFMMAMGIIAAGAWSLSFLKRHQKLGAPGVKVVALPLFDSQGKQFTDHSVAMPEKVLDFQSKPLFISTPEITTLPKDTTFGRRLYEHTDGLRIMSSVILMGADRTSIHKPEFCIPGQGWKIITQQVDNVKIERPTPYNLPVMKWIIEQKSKSQTGQVVDLRGIYVFWFVSRDRFTPHHSGRFLSTIKNLLRTGELERWSYVSYFTTCSVGEEDATFARLQSFISASVPEFQQASGSDPLLVNNSH